MKKVIQKTVLVVFFFCEVTALQAQGVYYETITKYDAQKYLAKLYSDMQALHPSLY